MRTLACMLLTGCLSGAAWGDVVVLPAVADATLSAAMANSNYGGGGSLSVASPASPNGEFQTLFRFDAAPVMVACNAAFGAGRWRIESVNLHLNAAFPNAFIYNPQQAGFMALDWLANDSWVEGTGNPAGPGTTGIMFAGLGALMGPTDELQGVFAFDGSTSAPAEYTFAPTAGMRADLAAGGLVSVRAYAAPGPPPQGIAYVFNSRTYTTPANRPALTVTGVAICAADFNQSGGLTVQDIFDFLGAWFAGSAAADFNHVNGLSVQDIFDFLGAWFGGC